MSRVCCQIYPGLLKQTGVKTKYIDPGSLCQKGHNESVDSVLREGCLDSWVFYSVQEDKRVVDRWLDEFSNEMHHGALDGKSYDHFYGYMFREKKNAV